MIIWLYCQVGEEELMMPYFLRWYAPQVDRLILLDGGMSDKTREIIRDCENAEIRDHPFGPDSFDDLEYIHYVNTLYHEARGQADYVIIVDVDEFLYTGKALRQSLEDYWIADIRAVKSIGCQMVASQFPHSDGQLPDEIQTGALDRIYNKVCVFDPKLDLRYSVGRHTCAIDNFNPVLTGMKLLHYRYFGDDYLSQRNQRNQARRSQADKEAGRGYHVAPDYYRGKYSAGWFGGILEEGINVVEG